MIQIAIFSGTDNSVQKKVNDWLSSREAQRYEIQSVKHTSTVVESIASRTVLVTVMVTYEDEPSVVHIKAHHSVPIINEPRPSSPE